MKERVGIVVFAFGTPSTTKANELLAKVGVGRCHVYSSVQVFTQRDIAITDTDISVQYCMENPGNPPPTLRIARQAVVWAKKERIMHLGIVAASPHVWRCRRDLLYAIKEANAQIGVFSIYSGVEYSPESTQPRVRSPKDWWPREIILRCMPMWLYRRVAG